ncbi:MAG TPA: class D sortase [Candidatus Saccharimonadia bacterium]
MSQSEIVRFPRSSMPNRDNNPDAAKEARERIAGINSPYLAHAAPAKEDLVGAIHPISPAANVQDGKPTADAPPFTISSSDDEPQPAPAAETTVSAQPATPEAHDHLLPPAHGANALPTQPQAAQTQPTPTIPPPNPLEQLSSGVPKKKTSHSNRPRTVAQPKSLPSRFMPLIVGVITFVLVLLVVKAPILLNQLSYFTNDKPPAAQNAPAANVVAVSPDPVITIPKINVSAPVIYTDNNAESIIQKHLESGVVHYAGTALPGTNGNSVIFGHSSNDWWEPGNYKFVFVLLDKLQPNDTFTVNYNSRQYLYQVTGSKVVQPTDLSVLNPTPEPTMTLITCTPPGTSWQRLVVTAKQISPVAETEKAPAIDEEVAADGTLPGNAPGIGQRLSDWWKGLTNVFTRE